ncbi:MAG: hypothetical protein R6W06_10850 [Prochlorococcaceae cyanobacterium]
MAAAAPIDQPNQGPRSRQRPQRPQLNPPLPQLSPEQRARRVAAFLQRSRIKPIRDLLNGTPGRPG